MKYSHEVALIDFSQTHHGDVLAEAYKNVYEPAFPVAEEREPLSKWVKRLTTDHPNNKINQYIILVVGQQLDDPAARVVEGICVGIYYKAMQTGLLAYIAVRPESRKNGLSRSMVESLTQQFNCYAVQDNERLKSILLEVHDPAKTNAGQDSINPAQRLGIYQKWGARKVDIDYVPPPLQKAQERIKNLMLLSLPMESGRYATAGTIEQFIQGMYIALGTVDPHIDPDFKKMQGQLKTGNLESVRKDPAQAPGPSLSL